MKKQISTFTLIMLIVGGIDSIRNLPATAMFGSSLIFFFVLSALVFLIPVALVSAELSAKFPEQGGVYAWVNMAFGDKFAFLTIWLQWINTMVWYPTILSFFAGTLAMLIDPSLAQNKTYLVTTILIVFWVMTLINLKGLKVSAKFASRCAVFGMLIPMAIIMILAIVWLVGGHPLHVHITSHTIIPNLGHGENWISLTAIMTAFLGMELSSVHVKQIKNAQKIFPKAMLGAVIIILITMVFGSLSIAFVLPKHDISLVNGVMEAFVNFFNIYHMHWMIPVLTIMLLVGTFGGVFNWIISPAKGMLLAGESGYLPKKLCKINQHGVASNILLTQALIVSFVCLAFLLMPSVNGSYWLLTDLSTQLYMGMYVLMFLAAAVLAYKYAHVKSIYTVSKSKLVMLFTCFAGLIGCFITIVIGFFPPASINVGGFWHYEIVFISGIAAMLLPAILFYIYKFQKSKTSKSLNLSA